MSALALGAGLEQQITLYSDSPLIQVTAIRGAGAPTVSDGYGGWTTVARPRKKALTEWQGTNPLQLQLPLLFDGYPDVSVELPCARLEQLAGLVLTPVGGRGEPPILRVIGAAPHASSATWVVQTLAWGDPVIYHPAGYRTRQAATVTLLEYVADDRLAGIGAAELARITALQQAAQAAAQAGVGGTTPPHDQHYTVRRGDTLTSIAASQLGDYKRWTEIADLNSLRDPRNVHVGQVIRLP